MLCADNPHQPPQPIGRTDLFRGIPALTVLVRMPAEACCIERIQGMAFIQQPSFFFQALTCKLDEEFWCLKVRARHLPHWSLACCRAYVL